MCPATTRRAPSYPDRRPTPTTRPVAVARVAERRPRPGRAASRHRSRWRRRCSGGISPRCSSRAPRCTWIVGPGRRRRAPNPATQPGDPAGPSPGLSDDEIADRLVRNAAGPPPAIGAVGGGVTSVEWTAAPTLLTAPAVLAAETVAVVAVEIKLIGELQELYGQPVPGRPTAAGGRAACRPGPAGGASTCWCPAGRRSRRARHRGPQGAAGPVCPPVRAQPDHARPAAHRRGRRRLPQPAGDPAAG